MKQVHNELLLLHEKKIASMIGEIVSNISNVVVNEISCSDNSKRETTIISNKDSIKHTMTSKPNSEELKTDNDRVNTPEEMPIANGNSCLLL